MLHLREARPLVHQEALGALRKRSILADEVSIDREQIGVELGVPLGVRELLQVEEGEVDVAEDEREIQRVIRRDRAGDARELRARLVQPLDARRDPRGGVIGDFAIEFVESERSTKGRLVLQQLVDDAIAQLCEAR